MTIEFQWERNYQCNQNSIENKIEKTKIPYFELFASEQFENFPINLIDFSFKIQFCFSCFLLHKQWFIFDSSIDVKLQITFGHTYTCTMVLRIEMWRNYIHWHLINRTFCLCLCSPRAARISLRKVTFDFLFVCKSISNIMTRNPLSCCNFLTNFNGIIQFLHFVTREYHWKRNEFNFQINIMRINLMQFLRYRFTVDIRKKTCQHSIVHFVSTVCS